MIGPGVAAPHMGEVVDWRIFFSGDFSGKRTTDPERSSPTYSTSIDAILAKDVSFRGLIDTSNLMGSYPRKSPHFWDVKGASSLNV
jgi:hypothetical protein